MNAKILEEIGAEREKQDARFGAAHDNRLSVAEWASLIDKRLYHLIHSWDSDMELDQRRAFIEIASIAVAAVAAYDRKGGL